jgi:Tfp pilus assembly protein PilF
VAGSPTALTPHQAAALDAAFAQLRRGDAVGAKAAVAAVLVTARGAPAALHLFALCQRDLGDLAGARRSFEAALAAAPNDVNILNNCGAFLRRLGETPASEANLLAATRLAPQRADLWLNLSVTQFELRKYRAAKLSAARAGEFAPDNPSPLLARASAERELGEFEAAETSLRQALALAPKNGAIWTALGVVRRLIGDPAEALECYAHARALGYAAPELLDAEASAYLDTGASEKALATARALTKAAPAYVAGHELLAHALWEHGASEENDPLAPFARAVAKQPEHDPLRQAFVNMLLEAKRPEEALTHLRTLRAARDSAALAAAHAAALEQAGDLAGATAVFAQALRRFGVPHGMGVAYAQHLIRVGRADEAIRFALLDTQHDPEDQQAWSTLSIAWRLTEDPREHWLCDYESFVMRGQIEPPEGYADHAAFIAALAQTLTAMHSAQHEPINQSLRGGTQTTGGLFGRKDPVIEGARDALRACVRRLLEALPKDTEHPFLRRNTGDVRFTGSWSVRLKSAGKHVNHFHPKGWLSSAFYVALPPSVSRDDPAHPGWIQFGQPPEDFGASLTPRRIVRPEVGTLVLFPSYMWHGTVPFQDAAPRMTIAFDAAPK